MKQKKDISPKKQIERLKAQIKKFGDSTGMKQVFINDLEDVIKNSKK